MGRKRISEQLRRSRSMSLTEEEHKLLKLLGDGKASVGIRKLIGLYKKVTGLIPDIGDLK